MLGKVAAFVGKKLLGGILGGGYKTKFTTYGKTFGRKDEPEDKGPQAIALAQQVGDLLRRRNKED